MLVINCMPLKTTADLCKFDMEKKETRTQVDMGVSAKKTNSQTSINENEDIF